MTCPANLDVAGANPLKSLMVIRNASVMVDQERKHRANQFLPISSSPYGTGQKPTTTRQKATGTDDQRLCTEQGYLSLFQRLVAQSSKWPKPCDDPSECSGAAGALGLQLEAPAFSMSVPSLALAPVPVTAATAASLRRPAPVRAESQPASFAELLDDAAPTETTPPIRNAKTADTPETAPTTADAEDSAAPLAADATAAPLAVVQPPVLPVILSPAADTPAPFDNTDARKANIAPEILLPVATTQTATPDEAVAPAVPVSAPSAAPPAPPAAAPAPTIETPREEAASETLDSDSSRVPPAPDAPPAPPRLRDVIEHAASRSSANSPSQSAPAQTTSTAADTAIAASSPVPQPTATDAPATQAKPAADATVLAAVTADAAEPTQAIASAPTADGRANEVPASAPILSTLSQGAIHATAQIAAQIVKKLEGRSTRFEMALTPDDMGRVDVSLDIDADGQLSARLAFDNPLAAADLRGRVDELRRQLTDAGFNVADDALSFDQRDASAGNNGFDRGNDRHSARAFGAASRLSLEAEASLIPPRWISLTLTPERVDMKV